jgi:hypothetical protein
MRRSLLASAAVVAAVIALAPGASGQGQTALSSNTQTPPLLNGAISGTVLDGSTGTSLAEVIVGLSAMPGTTMPAGYPARQMTDAKGRFAFLNLPNDGVFQITANKFGYLDGGYGRDSAPTDSLRSIVIASGTWIGGLRVNIWSPGVISGTVRDERGEPVVGVIVRALARIRVAGRDDLAAGPITVTDDQGRYRIPGLLPGRYIVQVPSPQMSVPGGTRINTAATNVPEGAIDVDDTSRLVIGRFPLPPPALNGRAMAYTVAFHPNASSPGEASTVDIKFGDDRPAVDLSLTPVPAVRVAGVVEGPPEALTSLTLRLLPIGMENLGLGAEVATASVGPNGTFTFLNVPAGSYVLDAPVTFNEFSVSSGSTSTGGYVGSRGFSMPVPPPRQSWSRSSQRIADVPGVNFSTADFRGAVSGTVVPNYSARLPITVGGADVAGVAVRLRPGAILDGKVTVELDPTKPASQTPPRFSFFMDPAGGQPALGQPPANTSVAANQEFEIAGLQPGEYFLRLRDLGAWAVKSVQWQGRDYTTVPFDAASAADLSGVSVTVTNALPTLMGTLRGQDGAVPESGLVIIFPAQMALRTNTGLWSPRMTSAPMQSNGTFRVTGLPAGDYIVAAIERSRMATWRDPEFLALVERQGTRVTLAWGQTASQDLTMVVVR